MHARCKFQYRQWFQRQTTLVPVIKFAKNGSLLEVQYHVMLDLCLNGLLYFCSVTREALWRHYNSRLLVFFLRSMYQYFLD